jgi:hypothetical protein
MNSNKHCLWNAKTGGMYHSSLLNNWQFVKAYEKSVYKSAIPITDITYNKNYAVDCCKFEFMYVSID